MSACNNKLYCVSLNDNIYMEKNDCKLMGQNGGDCMVMSHCGYEL